MDGLIILETVAGLFDFAMFQVFVGIILWGTYVLLIPVEAVCLK